MGYHVNACALQDICQQVFEAVHKGDAATVPSLLLQHRLSPDLTNTVSNIIINFVVLCTTIHCKNKLVVLTTERLYTLVADKQGL